MDYRPPLGFKNPHLQTIYPTLFRRVPLITRTRERLDTSDGDFLDLDWSTHEVPDRVALLTHGLESNSRSAYCQGMAKALVANGWSVLAWNFRGCSGEPNRKLQSYHSGATDELDIVLNHLWQRAPDAQVALIGFSLGGNLTLKYIGERRSSVDKRICAAVALSVPCDLKTSAHRLEALQNRIYMHRFMKMLREKVREKILRFPKEIEDLGLDKMRTFAEFDDVYTGPIHGFSGAEEYWETSSCRQFLGHISIPSLLINAEDDPFLSPLCYPHELADSNPKLFLETPKYGGHLGFIQFEKDKLYWSERKTLDFIQEASRN
ncbi:MAG: alpha/beta fold hydrolase [Verrucomicrobiota bacterium]